MKCELCGEDHPEHSLCPPHEVRSSGLKNAPHPPPLPWPPEWIEVEDRGDELWSGWECRWGPFVAAVAEDRMGWSLRYAQTTGWDSCESSLQAARHRCEAELAWQAFEHGRVVAVDVERQEPTS